MSINANMKRALSVVAAATLTVLSFSAQSADPTKVGFVYVGPVGDHGWTYRHDVG
ncbi:MAG: basic membrane protein A, partial [Gammaproteobacteria bacterium]